MSKQWIEAIIVIVYVCFIVVGMLILFAIESQMDKIAYLQEPHPKYPEYTRAHIIWDRLFGIYLVVLGLYGCVAVYCIGSLMVYGVKLALGFIH